METKLRALFAGQPGVKLNVAAVCRELEISRQTYYKYRRRYAAEGPAGLLERSRRPHRSPQLMSVAMEDRIVRLRKTLGSDNGAQSIYWALVRAGTTEPPSTSAIHQALRRRGQVLPAPQKRPRSSYRRFVWPRPNDAWQMDATSWVLRSGESVTVMNVLDDHSRYAVSEVADGPTAEAAWHVFLTACGILGLPARAMSDNGTCYTSRFGFGGQNVFELYLAQLGVRQIHSSPRHPQTCGKIERFHQTLKRWLTLQEPVEHHAELQEQLDTFLAYYNEGRPHRALAGATPAEAFAASEKALPGPPLKQVGSHLRPVGAHGNVYVDGYRFSVGMQRAGSEVLVVRNGLEIAFFGPEGLIQRQVIIPGRNNQPSGRPARRPPRATPG